VPKQEARDPARFCNEAAKCGRGDIASLSSQAGHAGAKYVRRQRSICFGEGVTALTARDAAAVTEATRPMGRWDLVLQGWSLTAEADTRACYVALPIGSGVAHKAGCCLEHFGVGRRRPSIWHERWVRCGARPW